MDKSVLLWSTVSYFYRQASEFSTGRLLLLLDLRNPVQLKSEAPLGGRRMRAGRPARNSLTVALMFLTALVGLTAALLQFLTGVLPLLF